MLLKFTALKIFPIFTSDQLKYCVFQFNADASGMKKDNRLPHCFEGHLRFTIDTVKLLIFYRQRLSV